MSNTQYRTSMLWCVLTAIVALPGCGGDTLPPPSDAVALSRHYVQVTFADPAGVAAEDAGNYVIAAPDGTELAIFQARLNKDGTTVILTTDAQDLVEYLISRASDSGAGGGIAPDPLRTSGRCWESCAGRSKVPACERLRRDTPDR